MRHKRKHGKLIRNIIIIVVILFAAAGFLIWHSRSTANQVVNAEQRTTFATRGTITSSLSSSGTLEPKDTYSITSLVSGEVVASYFEEGDEVEKDQVLYQINSSSMDSQITSVNNSLTRAEKNYQDAVDDYNEAVEKYSGNTYKSTRSGYIKALNVEAGDKISSNMDLATIYSDEIMRITVPFLSIDAEEIYVGEPATVILTDTEEELTGTVTNISALEEVMTGGRMIRQVEVEVENPRGLSTQHTATVSIGTSVTYEMQAVVIEPEEEYYEEESAENVIVSGEAAERLGVEPGKSSEEEGPGITENYATNEEGEIIYTEVPVVKSIVSVEEGNFEPVLDKTMQAELLGNGSVEIESMLVHKGDYISVGTPLFVLKADDVQDIIDSYKDAVDTAEERVESAQTSVDNTQDNYDNYTITAPISGTVIAKNTKTGDNINNNNSGATTMAVIYDLSELTFEMSIDELDIQNVEVGQRVEVTADAIENTVFEGEVTNVSLQSSYSNGVTNYPVTVTIKDYGRLLPGMNVDGIIILDEVEDAVLIPIGSLLRGNSVYVKDNSVTEEINGVPAGFREVKVETGLTNENYVEVISGVEEGDELYESATSGSITNMFQMGGMPGGMGGMNGGMQGGAMPSGGGNMGGMNGGNMGGGMRR